MPTTRPWPALSIGPAKAVALAAAWAVAGNAAAAGIGAGSASAVLGQPLDFAVQGRLDAGERLTPECVSAEVPAGDRRVPPPLVRALVEMTGTDTARVRVQTQPAIDEPVVGVQLTLGCSLRMTRRYVVLADPPPVLAPASVAPVSLAAAAVAAAPAFAANPAPVPPPAPWPGASAGGNGGVVDGSAFAAPGMSMPAPSTAPAAAPAPRPLTAAELQAQAQRRAERRAARDAAREAARQRNARRAA
ncbi:MAG: hypothetical protein LH480_08455, partial [Rubrivivax sp.]|nr:hypothetical protein [Rubrivivax sp.]